MAPCFLVLIEDFRFPGYGVITMKMGSLISYFPGILRVAEDVPLRLSEVTKDQMTMHANSISVQDGDGLLDRGRSQAFL